MITISFHKPRRLIRQSWRWWKTTGGFTMSDVVRFKYQRLLKCLPEGQWLTTADYFALVPRALIRHPWLAHRNLEILAERNLIIADKTTKPMKWLKPISTIGHA